METFGAYIRWLRRQRGVSQATLAERAGLARRTIAYWEAGEREARLPELEAVLDTLQANAGERARAVALITASRAVRVTRLEGQSSEFSNGGQLPCTGDLLRAMRLRRGWSAERLASTLGVTRTTVARWERGQTLPSDEMAEQACSVLRALPEEQQTFLSRRLSASEARLSTLDDCALGVEQLIRSVHEVNPLSELRALILKRQLHLLRMSDETAALPLLIQTEIEHSKWTLFQDRDSEAVQFARRVLQISEVAAVAESLLRAAVNLVSAIPYRQGHPEKAFAESLKWLPAIEAPANRACLLADMALYASCLHDRESASRLLGAADEDARRSSGVPHAVNYCLLTRARVLTQIGKPHEAMRCLPATAAVDANQLILHLCWVEALLAAGDHTAAEAHLTRSMALVEGKGARTMEKRLEKLSRQL